MVRGCVTTSRWRMITNARGGPTLSRSSAFTFINILGKKTGFFRLFT
jgi:hypothetical protein